MNFIALTGVEFKKIRRSKIVFILLIAVIILWVPSVVNADINFKNQALMGVTPENNFLIQGLLGMSWFMYPASMVVCMVLLQQTERGNKGILKMLSLPVNTIKLCLSKFFVALSLAALQIVMVVGVYFICALAATQIQNYDFVLSPLFVFKLAAYVYLSSIPMLIFFWMLSVCIQTPIFSVGIGLAAIVPSVIMINTKVWFVYPMCYPFYVITSQYGKMSAGGSSMNMDIIPWIPIAVVFTVACLVISCLWYGRAERR